MSRIEQNDVNLLLRTLPSDVRRQLASEAEHHALRTILIHAEETPKHVFFPHAGSVVSIVRSTVSGQMVEAGIVGREGVFSVHSLLAPSVPTGSQAIVQSAGSFSRLDVSRLSELSETHAAFREATLMYASVFLDQVTQNLVCNRLHAIEQRLAKWLLMMNDRILSGELTLTQEFLGYMLGAHRPAVSVAVSALEADGLVRHRRNVLEIVDAEGVVGRACECYRPLHRKLGEFASSVTVAH